uniref:Chemosensory protein n=1 Tax=Timema shepardi TaxID=629360 RepID=A0A7R9G427_TIMSH|nr:unnamed protein product [Timema shepardi]
MSVGTRREVLCSALDQIEKEEYNHVKCLNELVKNKSYNVVLAEEACNEPNVIVLDGVGRLRTSAVELNTTSALANYATEAAVELNTTGTLANYATKAGTQGEDYPDPVALTNKANEENLTNILKCFYSEGECPKGTVELKAIFPTVAVSACSNCNPTQKQWFRIVGRYLLANRPADIKKLRETFDPSEEHKEEFLKFITSDD